MHTRRLVAFLLGVWLGGMLFVAYTTNVNVSTTKSILESAPEGPRRLIELAGPDRSSTLLLYNTAELNRMITGSWEWFQLLIGLGVVCALPFALRLKWIYLIAAGVMFLIALAQRTLLTPEMIGLGRMIDMAGGTFSTQDALWQERRSLHTLEELYLSAEIVKATIGLGLTAALLIFRKKTVYKNRAERHSEASAAERDRARRQDWPERTPEPVRTSEKVDTVDDPD